MKAYLLFTFAAGLTAVCSPVLAHHSFAMFDRGKQTSLHGTVRQFQWTNPHSWVDLTVRAPDGSTEEWSLEALSPNVLSRMGWKRNSLIAGEEVTAVFNPTRDGSQGGNLVSVTRANGQIVGSSAP